MKFLLENTDIAISSREVIAVILAVISFAGSLAWGYGVKSQQVSELQTIAVRHDGAIMMLSQELVMLRIAVAELNGTMTRNSGK